MASQSETDDTIEYMITIFNSTEMAFTKNFTISFPNPEAGSSLIYSVDTSLEEFAFLVNSQPHTLYSYNYASQ